MILPMGAAPEAPPPSVLSCVPFVCGVNAGGLLCGTSIESIESIESIKSLESIETVRVYRFKRFYRFYRFYTRATQKTAGIHTTHKGDAR